MTALLSYFFLFLPFQFSLQLAAGFDMPIIRVLGLGIFLAWLILSLARKRLIFPAHPIAFFLLSWIFFVILSISVAQNTDWSLRKLLFLFSFLPLFFVLADTFQKYRGAAERILQSFVIGAGFAACIALIQWLLQFSLGIDPLITLLTRSIWPFFLGDSLSTMVAQYPSFLVNIQGHTLFRAVGLFPDPHIAAYYFEMAFPCAIALGLSDNKHALRWFLSAGLLLLADLLTFSRGSYVGLLFAALFGLGWYSVRIFHSSAPSPKKLARNFLGILILGVVFLFSPISSRFLSSFSAMDTSNQGRFAMWQEAGLALTNHPWLGVGLGNFPLFVDPSTNYRTPIYAHNLFLDTGAETGLWSCLFLFFCFVSALVSLFRLGRRDALFSGPLFGLLIFLGHSFFENPLFSVHILPLLCLFLAFGTLSLSKSSLEPML